MARLNHKRQSKRQTCRTKYKIVKKVKEHNKKAKKQARLLSGKKKHIKDPGIPNSLPFKEDVLRDALAMKQLAQNEKKKHLERLKKSNKSLHDVVANAAIKQLKFSNKQLSSNEVVEESNYQQSNNAVENSNCFYKEFRKLTNTADIFLEVLDARDPLGSRCLEAEQEIIVMGKKLVLVLNKIDLIPKENVSQWLTYLRKQHPTIAFKASTQQQKHNLSRSRVDIMNASQNLLQSAVCLGADALMELLGNYTRKGDVRTVITVGVIGLPNTGKSSLINALKRTRVCEIGAVPGVTKHCQEVHLDKHVKLIDCPGVVLSRPRSAEDYCDLVLRNCIRVDSIADASVPVEAILRRCRKQALMFKYGIGDFSGVSDFLHQLALRLGRMRKGGIPDTQRAAKKVLEDWIHGYITYYTVPPEEDTQLKSNQIEIDEVLTEKVTVNQFSAPFDINKADVKVFKELKAGNAMLDIVIPSSNPLPMCTTEELDNDDDGDESEDMEENSDDEGSFESCMSGDENEDDNDESDDNEPVVKDERNIKHPKAKNQRVRGGDYVTSTLVLKGSQINKDRKKKQALMRKKQAKLLKSKMAVD